MKLFIGSRRYPNPSTERILQLKLPSWEKTVRIPDYQKALDDGFKRRAEEKRARKNARRARARD